VSKLVTLSTGEEVHFKEKFTHKAEKVYFNTLNKGAVEKEYLDDGKVVREYPVQNASEAIEAAILCMIERVRKADQEFAASPDWIGELSEQDYDLLATALVEIRKAGKERGKKSS
jgi:hypothetical protein